MGTFKRIGVDSYSRVAEVAADMTQSTGQDVKSAAMQLSKALEDPSKRVTDLARSGTVFTDAQKAQIEALQESGDILGAQAMILAELEKQYGGAAAAAGNGFAGALDKVKEDGADVLEMFGKLITDGASPFTKAMQGFGAALGFIKDNFGAVGNAMKAFWGLLDNTIGALLRGIGSVLGPIDQFGQQFQMAFNIAAVVVGDLANVLGPFFTWLGTTPRRSVRP